MFSYTVSASCPRQEVRSRFARVTRSRSGRAPFAVGINDMNGSQGLSPAVRGTWQQSFTRLGGEQADGVNDVHFHPVEPRSFRVTLTTSF